MATDATAAERRMIMVKCKYEGTGIWNGRCVGTKEVDPCPGYDKCKEYKPDYMTNADRIRSMSDEELAEWLTNMCNFINPEDEEPYKSIYNIDTEKEETVHDSYGSIMDWLQSKVE